MGCCCAIPPSWKATTVCPVEPGIKLQSGAEKPSQHMTGRARFRRTARGGQRPGSRSPENAAGLFQCKWDSISAHGACSIQAHRARRPTTWQRKSRKCCRNCFSVSVCGVPATSATMLQGKRPCSAVCLYRLLSTTCAQQGSISTAEALLACCTHSGVRGRQVHTDKRKPRQKLMQKP